MGVFFVSYPTLPKKIVKINLNKIWWFQKLVLFSCTKSKNMVNLSDYGTPLEQIIVPIMFVITIVVTILLYKLDKELSKWVKD